MATNLEYKSARCVAADSFARPSLVTYAPGGMLTLKVSRLSIGAASSDSFRVTALEDGAVLLSETGEADIPFDCDPRWCNTSVFLIPQPVMSRLTVFVEDLVYRERRRFVFELSDSEPCE